MGRCCAESPRAGLHITFERLMRVVEDNAFTKTYLGGRNMFGYIFQCGGSDLILKEAATLWNQILGFICTVLDKVLTHDWKTHFGYLADEYYDSFPRANGSLHNAHYSLPAAFQQELRPSQNPLLFPIEELCLRISRNFFQDLECDLAAAQINCVLSLRPTSKDFIKDWMDNAFLSPSTYTPLPIAEFRNY
jgi:hypothetical protein